MSRTLFRLFTLAATLSFAACDDSTVVGEPGSFSLLLTDEAGDFTQAVVTIERIELVGGEEGATVLMDEPFTTDLLTLSNDIEALVEDVTVPPGTYDQLRFVITEACIGVEQEDESVLVYASDGFEECGPIDGNLQMPSFDASGLKVTFPDGPVEIAGDAHILLLDFDVSQSFGQQAGMSGMWVMHPVIHADDLSLSGSIEVEMTVAEEVDLEALEASLADFTAQLNDEEPIAFADEDGTFTVTFQYVMPGEHDIAIGLAEGVSFDFTLDPASPQTVTLPGSGDASVAFEVTAAAPSS
jgi:hypothetical protein